MAEDHTRFADEIAEIENRSGKRRMFLVLGGVLGAILLAIVVVGARERMRLAEVAARPQFEPVILGEHVGTVANTALFARGDSVYYVTGVGDAEIGPSTEFVRPITYDRLGNPDTIPPGTSYWSIVSTDSLPWVVERVTNPLTGVTPTDYQQIELGALRPEDYRSGGPRDWAPMEQEDTSVRVTGRAIERQNAVYLVDDPSRIRLQGIEGLSGVDSLEVAWATGNEAPLTAFGTIASTPRGGADQALFVLSVNAVHPALPAAPVASDTTAAPPGPAAPAAPADTATP